MNDYDPSEDLAASRKRREWDAGRTSNEEMLIDFEWAVRRHNDIGDQYTLAEVREQRAEILKRMQPLETSAPPCSACVEAHEQIRDFGIADGDLADRVGDLIERLCDCEVSLGTLDPGATSEYWLKYGSRAPETSAPHPTAVALRELADSHEAQGFNDMIGFTPTALRRFADQIDAVRTAETTCCEVPDGWALVPREADDVIGAYIPYGNGPQGRDFYRRLVAVAELSGGASIRVRHWSCNIEARGHGRCAEWCRIPDQCPGSAEVMHRPSPVKASGESSGKIMKEPQ